MKNHPSAIDLHARTLSTRLISVPPSPSRRVTLVIQFSVTLDCLRLHERAIGFAFTIDKIVRTCLSASFGCSGETAIANIGPDEARRILERTCDKVKLRGNSNGECLGAEIMDSLREAGVELGAKHLEILQTRSLLLQGMELLGEEYSAEILQDYDNRIPLSTALRFLSQAIERTKGLEN